MLHRWRGLSGHGKALHYLTRAFLLSCSRCVRDVEGVPGRHLRPCRRRPRSVSEWGFGEEGLRVRSLAPAKKSPVITLASATSRSPPSPPPTQRHVGLAAGSPAVLPRPRGPDDASTPTRRKWSRRRRAPRRPRDATTPGTPGQAHARGSVTLGPAADSVLAQGRRREVVGRRRRPASLKPPRSRERDHENTTPLEFLGTDICRSPLS